MKVWRAYRLWRMCGFPRLDALKLARAHREIIAEVERVILRAAEKQINGEVCNGR